MTDLFLFGNDLRIEDNPALARHADASALLCVYIRQPARPWCQQLGLGTQRQRFLDESLQALQSALRRRGQDLLVLSGDPLRVLPRLIDHYGVNRVGLSLSPGVHEQDMVRQLRARLDIPLMESTGNTLYDAEIIQARFRKFPKQYTPFRREIETVEHLPASGNVELPPPPRNINTQTLPPTKARPHLSHVVRGGSAEAQQRLHAWLLRERAVDHYAETRNALEGLYFASHLSPWLANGSLSVRAAADALTRYEASHGPSDSTEHWRRELLWREFFHWRAYEDGHRLFHRDGLSKKKKHLHTFEPRQYARWCAGDTDYPLVNALMRQLVATGWMSNRGRQVAASCLVNELGIDWRYGAAFFEKHLIDFDVAANYGNWQYLAGVGTDPRGGRHFDIDKQTRQFDPDGSFVQRWGGVRPPQPLHTVDPADWPLDPAGSD